MFFEPVCKGSCRFTYIFFLTPIFTRCESVYDPTFDDNWIFVLGGHEEIFYGLTSFEVYLYTIFLTSVFEPLTQPLLIWYHHVYVFVNCFHLAILIVAVVVCSSYWILAFDFCSIDGPYWVLAFLEGLAQMVFFFLLQLLVRAYYFSCVIQGTSHTIFEGYGMLAVPWFSYCLLSDKWNQHILQQLTGVIAS